MEKNNGRTIRVKDVIIGEGIPKICVSVMGKTVEDVLSETRALEGHPVDLVEWRADAFEEVLDPARVEHVLGKLQQVLEGIPLIFTLRSEREGGMLTLKPQVYAGILKTAIHSAHVDLIDVETFMEDHVVPGIIHEAHEAGVSVIASYHDFEKTPSKEGMVQRLLKMGEMGADILKLSVMARSKSDVLTLLDTTTTMKAQHPEWPIVTVSMGKDGLISRLAGEVFGSAITFGSVEGRTSAPGQVDAHALEQVMRVIHENLAD